MTSRTMILGLDGASLELIEAWAEVGDLPNLQTLLQRGSYGHLRSVMPVLSSAAWASFFTGCNPAKHGIYDFVQRDLQTYKRRLVLGGSTIETPSLWRLLSQQGKRVSIVNVPMTYPPEAVNGFLIAGLGSPEGRPFAYPPSYNETLQASGYRVNKRFHFEPGKEQAYLDEIYAITDLQATIALELAQQQPWDLFMHVIRDPDEISHFFWRFMDKQHPAHDRNAAQHFKQAIHDYYQHVDSWVGRFVEVAGAETDIIIMSDHGSGPLYKDVMLNRWLEEQGYLKIARSQATPSKLRSTLAQMGLHRQRISDLLRGAGLGKLERLIKDLLGERIQILAASERAEMSELIDWSATQAYSFGYHGQIYLNLRGREAQGIVDPADYATLCAELETKLLALIDPEDGNPVVSAVYRKEALFAGAHLHLAPDLTVIMRDLGYITRQGYEFSQKGEGLFATPHTGESGSHREMGVLIGAGPSFAKQGRIAKPASILDIMPTVMKLHTGLVPNGIDGTVLTDWLSASQGTPSTMAELHELPPQEAGTSLPSTPDDDLLWKHLRSLGYVE